MKTKNLLILSILSTAVVLSACGSGASNISEENTETETIATADTETESTETESTETTDTETESDDAIAWIALGELDNYQELRNALESFLKITTNDANEKEGILYKNPDTLETDQNTTLYLNLRIQDYSVMFQKSSIDDIEKIASASESSFSDIDEDTALAATINAYYNLLPDETEGIFNGNATLTRAQAMALVMRAMTPVAESGEPDSNETFTSAVGCTSYTDYAAAVDDFAYLSVANGTLNTDNFTTAMTKGEFTYLVIKTLTTTFRNFIDENADKLAYADGYVDDLFDGSSVNIASIKDAGDISLTDALANPDNGVPSDMYKTFQLGIDLCLITESDLEDWNTAITKTDAINTFIDETVNMMRCSYIDGDYSITSDTTSTLATRRAHQEAVASGEFTDVYEDTRPAEEVTYETTAGYDLWKNSEFGEYGQLSRDEAEQNWISYAIENGADGARNGYYWYYEKGSAAGDSGSYLVYMREGSPYYGQVFQYGDTLLDGSINNNGTNQEYYDWVTEGAQQKLIDAGATITYKEDGTAVFNLDTISD